MALLPVNLFEKAKSQAYLKTYRIKLLTVALSKHTKIWELVVWRAVSSPIKYSCPSRDWFPDLWQIPKFRRFSRPLYKMTFVYRLQQVYLHITLFLWQIQILLFGTFWDSPPPSIFNPIYWIHGCRIWEYTGLCVLILALLVSQGYWNQIDKGTRLQKPLSVFVLL